MQSPSQPKSQAFPLDTQNVNDLYQQLKFYGMALSLLDEKGSPEMKVDFLTDDN
jgi:hypothetical protein